MVQAMAELNKPRALTASWWNGTPGWYKRAVCEPAADNRADLRQFKEVLQKSSNNYIENLATLKARIEMDSLQAAKKYGLTQ